ncbi:MAG: hypothetical protein UX99_C0036G0003 [Candidatus Amesbacteria bacterium GW2011_GWB1_47_26]|nr:MAG: hypothetical protein UX99_C0036G0003 [Candidatus Amesbacteria bacterium GW2011_GWB1_47_26]
MALHPNVIALTGPLGAGKTTLTKAIAKELGIKDIVVSPTFILHREYPGLDHIDAWRVEDFSEIERLGLIEMIKNKHLVIIEWADKFRKQISNLKSQATIVWVKLNYGEKENERRIEYEDISN